MEKKELIIFGAGGHASKLIGIIEEQGHFNILGYISTEKPGTILHNYPVLGDIEDYTGSTALQEKYYHIAVGENSVRHRIYQVVNSPGHSRERLAAVISSHSLISPDAVVERGTAVAHNAVIWNRVKIGICCIIDTGAIVEHDAVIGDFVNISPGAVICGGVNIGWGAAVGAGATIIEKVKIGENTLVGAGSIVINDIDANVMAVGNPARVVRKRKFTETYLR
ncbi:MAG: acetyltransferase [Candidatus Aminicenantes bacterium]|nr:acetyltransferase [Candidatus Aminicenantes bacterium]NIM82165.1 acetyltransferase [Candidatus Aminicenantes bacterium]NIN21566.1 acetyltransferase [Candidatus Aminicenantes bacterium]NIN45375.1 acetyltransferase [Candidatus Aminicenantes bacterium]NIN88196.1 acetyltransferase [Candidatus Aminicenantes bacterium]